MEIPKEKRIPRSRLVGFYLLYLGGIIAMTGIGLGLLAYRLHPLHYAGGGPKDSAEAALAISGLQRSLTFCSAIVGIGFLIAMFGIRWLFKTAANTTVAMQNSGSSRDT